MRLNWTTHKDCIRNCRKVNRHTEEVERLEKEDSSVRTQHNHLYVGSTSELQKFLKKESKKKDGNST